MWGNNSVASCEWQVQFSLTTVKSLPQPITIRLIGVGGAALIAIALFHYSVFDLGLPLIAFFVNLIVMGWAIGLLVSGIVLRYGLGAESLAWIGIFALQPLSGVYYPIDVLPHWLQYVAWLLPSSHVFEGMRAVLIEHTFRPDLLLNALARRAGHLQCELTCAP